MIGAISSHYVAAGGGGGGTPAPLTLTASATMTVYNANPPANMVDGSMSTSYQSSGGAVVGDWLKVDAGSTKTVTEVGIYQTATGGGGDRILNWSLEYSTDDTTWTVHSTGTSQDIILSGLTLTARYVRLRATVAQGAWVSCREFQLKGY